MGFCSGTMILQFDGGLFFPASQVASLPQSTVDSTIGTVGFFHVLLSLMRDVSNSDPAFASFELKTPHKIGFGHSSVGADSGFRSEIETAGLKFSALRNQLAN